MSKRASSPPVSIRGKDSGRLHHVAGAPAQAAKKDAYLGWPLAPSMTHYDKCVTHYNAKNTLAAEWGEAT